jgi:hypothetical protein
MDRTKKNWTEDADERRGRQNEQKIGKQTPYKGKKRMNETIRSRIDSIDRQNPMKIS